MQGRGRRKIDQEDLLVNGSRSWSNNGTIKYRSTILWMNRCTSRGNGRFQPRSVNRFILRISRISGEISFILKLE